MRGFMRAIGLGRLFCRSAETTTSTGSFRVLTLEQFEKMTTVDNSAAFEARSSCYSSSTERPQFLFFCGSEPLAPKTTSSDGSTLYSRLISMSNPTPVQPVIDHHMPVFFMPPLSPVGPAVGAGFYGY